MGRPKPPTPMRVLVNNVESLTGQAVVDALKKEGHSVVALVTPESSGPEDMDHLVLETVTEEFIESALTMDGFIFQLEGHTKQSMDVLQVLVESDLHKDKIFIGVSSLVTWAGTQPSIPLKELEDGEEEPEEDEDGEEPRMEPGAIREADCSRRVLGDAAIRRQQHLEAGVNLPEDPGLGVIHDVENYIVRSRREGLDTYVVNSGLLYGRGETDILHPLFRQSWELQPTPFPFDYTQPVLSEEEKKARAEVEAAEEARKQAALEAEEDYEPQPLPALRGRGANYVPMIHVDDLACSLSKLVSVYPAMEHPFVLAVDKSRHTLADLVGALSHKLGSGETKELTSEETAEMVGMEQLQLDLRVQQGAINKLMPKQKHWKCRDGIVSSLPTVLQEFRVARGVTPVKLVVTGPPGSGKTSLAAQLAKHYKVEHLQISEVIQRATELQPKKFAKALKRAKKKGGRLPDRVVNDMYRMVLQTQSCKNQGYILDGYPKSYTQAKWLTHGWAEHEPAEDEEEPPPEADPDFAYGYYKPPVEGEEEEPEEDEEEEEPEEEPDEPEDEDEEAKEARLAKELAVVNKQCTPSQVVVLEASDEEVRSYVMAIPEELSVAGHSDEMGMARRLSLYHANNVEGTDTALALLGADLEIPVETIVVGQQTSNELLEQTVSVMGEPHNYGPTEEEVRAAREAKEAKERAIAEEEARVLAEKLEAERLAKLARDKSEAAKMEEIRNLDQSRLLRQAVPLRKFLQNNVMAVVRKGLIECAEVRPEDPVDYLAQYLLKNNTRIE